MSKRLKTLPQSPIFSPKPDMSPRPIDSAFSNHVAEKPIDSAFSNQVAEKGSQQGTSKVSNELEKRSDPVTPNEKRPASRLGLFPKTTGPLTPSQASNRSHNDQESSPGSRTFTNNSGDSPRPHTHSSKSSVSMSLRNFFHRKMPSTSVF